MTEPIDPAEVEAIVGIQRHAVDHYMRADTKRQVTSILHSAECLADGDGTPYGNCPYIAAQNKGIDGLHEWEGCHDQPVKVEIDDDGYLVPSYVEIPEAERFKPGARVKVMRDAVDPGDGSLGGTYVIDTYVDAKQRDMPLPYYMVNAPDGSMYGGCIPHAALEQVATPEEQAEASKLPEPEVLMKAVSSALHSMFGDDISIDETSLLKESPDPDDSWPEGAHPYKHGVEFVGQTEGGRRFAGTLRLTSLYEAD